MPLLLYVLVLLMLVIHVLAVKIVPKKLCMRVFMITI
jgi:hypothetical protein